MVIFDGYWCLSLLVGPLKMFKFGRIGDPFLIVVNLPVIPCFFFHILLFPFKFL